VSHSLMVRTLNFDLVKNAIENAKQADNFETLAHFEYILSKLLRKVRIMITNSITPNLSDFVLLKRTTELYFLVISIQN